MPLQTGSAKFLLLFLKVSATFVFSTWFILGKLWEKLALNNVCEFALVVVQRNDTSVYTQIWV